MFNLKSIEFDIMYKDEKTGYVNYNKDNGILIAETYVESIQKSLWKPGTKVNLNFLEEIIEDRCFQESRPDKPYLLQIMGLSQYHPQDIVRITRGMIKEDFIWLRFPEDISNNITYEDIKIRYDNSDVKYSTSTSPIVITDQNLVKKSGTTKGAATKWNIEGDLWIKENLLGYECRSEKVVSDILKLSSLSESQYVKYNLCNVTVEHDNSKEIEACISESFLEDGESLITFGRIFQYSTIDITAWHKRNKSVLDRFNSMVEILHNATGLDLTDYIKRTIALDYLILNEDRHMNNFAIIIKEDGTFKECPIFDNGLSLLSDTRSNYYPIDNKPTRFYINKVKSPGIFSTDLKKQFKIICDGEPPFKIDVDLYNEYIENSKGKIGRVTSILRDRLVSCPEFFINNNSKITNL